MHQLQRLPSVFLLLTLPAAGCTGTGARPLPERLRDLASRGPLVVAHRGDSGEYPENTLPAFEAAVSRGADLVELDFMQTRDGVLVCFHDKYLDRTTDCEQTFGLQKVQVEDYTLAELRRLDAGSFKGSRFRGTRIPTLESALISIQRGSITMIEHKRGDPARLVALLRRMDLLEDVLVQSFDWRFLAALRQLEPRIMLGALGGTGRRPRPDLDEIRRSGAQLVHWNLDRLLPEDAAALRAAGLLVCVYTLNSTEQYDKAIALGVDAITTDHPARLRAHVASH